MASITWTNVYIRCYIYTYLCNNSRFLRVCCLYKMQMKCVLICMYLCLMRGKEYTIIQKMLKYFFPTSSWYSKNVCLHYTNWWIGDFFFHSLKIKHWARLSLWGWVPLSTACTPPHGRTPSGRICLGPTKRTHAPLHWSTYGAISSSCPSKIWLVVLLVK